MRAPRGKSPASAIYLVIIGTFAVFIAIMAGMERLPATEQPKPPERWKVGDQQEISTGAGRFDLFVVEDIVRKKKYTILRRSMSEGDGIVLDTYEDKEDGRAREVPGGPEKNQGLPASQTLIVPGH